MKTIIILLFTIIIILPAHIRSQVHEEWDVRYKGPNDNSVTPKTVKHDSYGNVYVFATASKNSFVSSVIVKYNSRGEIQWEARKDSCSPINIEIDLLGNVYASFFADYKGYICKYSSFGALQWQVTKVAYLKDMTIDDFGNVYITGRDSSSYFSGVQTIKYNSSGVILWQQIYSSNLSLSYGRRIQLDNAGNVYSLAEWDYDIRVFKYNNNGQLQWVANTPQKFDLDYHGFSGLGIDDNGCVYIGGTYYNQSNSDFIIAKFSENGIFLWNKIYNSEYNLQDYPKDMIVNSLGDVYITGQSYTSSENSNTKVTTIKYDSSGTLKWKNHYANTNGYVFPSALTTDIFGNIYLVINNRNYEKITTIKYEPAGTQKWLIDYIGATTQSVVKDVSADNYGNVYFCGYTSGNKSGEMLTVRYLQSWNTGFTLTGHVDYLDNNQPVEGGYIKAVKLEKSSGNIVTIDSTPIQVTGNFSLKRITSDSLYLIAFPPQNLAYIPTYYPQGINWQNAQKLFPTANISGLNIKVQRINNSSGNCSIKGKIIKTNPEVTNLKDAFVYVKSGNDFLKFGTSDGNGIYQINSIQQGNVKLIVDRLGYSPDSLSMNLLSGNSYENVNFNLNQIYVNIQWNNKIIPTKYFLNQNYPNPFNPSTKIRFDIIKSGIVKLEVYDIVGRKLQTLINENLQPGTYETTFDAAGLSSGIYFYKLTTDGFSQTKKMLLLK